MPHDLSAFERSGPLSGTTVVDLSHALAGPYATLMLADAGALVIKVEKPGAGDESRGWGPPFLGSADSRVSTYFLSVNRNKLSVEIDLRDSEDLARLKELIGRSDVLVENFRPGTLEAMGLDDRALGQLNPRLVVLSITGFGRDGPAGQRAGYDQILQGEAGLMSLTGSSDAPPTKVGVPICDLLAGMFGAFGVLAALHERSRTGRGQVVRTSLLEAALAVHTYQATRWLVAGELPGREGNTHPTISPYGTYRCNDEYINVAVGSERLWQVFAPLMQIDPVDPRFTTNELRREHRNELNCLLSERFSSASCTDWLERLDRAGIPAGRIRDIDDVYNWDQVKYLDAIDKISHNLGEIAVPAHPVSYSSCQEQSRSFPPPLLGEHSDLIAEWLSETRSREPWQ